MIIYLCMKYESNTPKYSKDIAWKPFFVCMGRTYVRTDVQTRVMLYAPPIINGRGIKIADLVLLLLEKMSPLHRNNFRIQFPCSLSKRYHPVPAKVVTQTIFGQPEEGKVIRHKCLIWTVVILNSCIAME